jgi:hypothetical protein
MVVVVADTILEPGRRPGRLNAPDEAFSDHQAKGVVHRLERDGADFRPDDLGRGIGRDVRSTRDGPQNSQALGCDLNTALTKTVSWVNGHGNRLDQVFD